jgi:putative transcriptional regulator
MSQKKTVRQLREERGLSREALAVAVNTTFSTVVRIELRKHNPRLDLAFRIAEFFGVPVEDIDWGKMLAVAA